MPYSTGAGFRCQRPGKACLLCGLLPFFLHWWVLWTPDLSLCTGQAQGDRLRCGAKDPEAL